MCAEVESLHQTPKSFLSSFVLFIIIFVEPLWLFDHKCLSHCRYFQWLNVLLVILVNAQLYILAILFMLVCLFIGSNVAVLDLMFCNRIKKHWRLFQEWSYLWRGLSFDKSVLIYGNILGKFILMYESERSNEFFF